MEYRLLLHLGVVAIEKGAIGSPSTKVANFTVTYKRKPEAIIEAKEATIIGGIPIQTEGQINI